MAEVDMSSLDPDQLAAVQKFVAENYTPDGESGKAETPDVVVDGAASSPAEIEATGSTMMAVTYNDAEYRVPASADDWPIEALEHAEAGQPTGILRHVLGESQYQLFKSRNPRVRDLRVFSDKIARLSGFADKPGKIAAPFARAVSTFTALRGFLALIRVLPELIEADLSRFHGIDYRDRWRRDPDGVRRLTLRMIYVRVLRLPADSALSLHFSDGQSTWDLHAHLLADLIKHMVGVEYTARPGADDKSTAETEEQSLARERKHAAARERARAHNSKTQDVAADIARARENARAIEGGGSHV
ncbi:tail assembly chaperone [Gordonia phage Mulch]|uniref:Tail assembly chaperone n=14 Tax=Betterkatzvirus betterkatz TaxID=2560485 RepID=A0A2Z5HEI7_9CAUD|nr:tail assembly chaperone [Gordonia phage BetterKatz]AXC38097.1 tail assembly chaperone [Gordonia phage Nadeem]AZS11187.1 tail assembly chaperone [Gordonia phage WheatThin]QAU06817.1 tail assembly chaperone [Gordonia phage Brylie]QAX92515.1 tail assembly chaperone [Gordonia phage Mulch]QAY06476.1 tail assembly chaperone [Gordonia phage Parada]QPL13894.1 tail assembly chaperone [Gordonia phage NancyRae]